MSHGPSVESQPAERSTLCHAKFTPGLAGWMSDGFGILCRNWGCSDLVQSYVRSSPPEQLTHPWDSSDCVIGGVHPRIGQD